MLALKQKETFFLCLSIKRVYQTEFSVYTMVPYMYPTLNVSGDFPHFLCEKRNPNCANPARNRLQINCNVILFTQQEPIHLPGMNIICIIMVLETRKVNMNEP